MENNNLESRLTIRISDDDIKTLKRISSKQRISISAYLRQAISKDLNNE